MQIKFNKIKHFLKGLQHLFNSPLFIPLFSPSWVPPDVEHRVVIKEHLHQEGPLFLGMSVAWHQNSLEQIFFAWMKWCTHFFPYGPPVFFVLLLLLFSSFSSSLDLPDLSVLPLSFHPLFPLSIYCHMSSSPSLHVHEPYLCLYSLPAAEMLGYFFFYFFVGWSPFQRSLLITGEWQDR